jgi:hypothetical protein
MQIHRATQIAGLGMLALLSSGCASTFIEQRLGSERVRLVDATEVAACQSKGNTTVSVLAKVGFFNRSIADVDANLAQLARNSAVDLGGDTIVKGERLEIGKQVFAIYKCR